MALPPPRSRKYCSVYGCMNSTLIKPELAYFTLPKDALRRSQWLHLISREDLSYKPATCYTVCEEHFNVHDIIPDTRRKKLRMFASPSLNLPTLQKREKATQTEKVLKNLDKHVQTDDVTENTLNNCNAPHKRNLKPEHSECNKKAKRTIFEGLSVKHQKDIFRKLCDKFLTKELAQLAKAQTCEKKGGSLSLPACSSLQLDLSRSLIVSPVFGGSWSKQN